MNPNLKTEIIQRRREKAQVHESDKVYDNVSMALYWWQTGQDLGYIDARNAHLCWLKLYHNSRMQSREAAVQLFGLIPSDKETWDVYSY